jgi:hypothetical protein
LPTVPKEIYNKREGGDEDMTQPTKTYTDKNETGCCPVPDVNAWDGQTVTWEGKKFIKDATISFLHVPINMKQVINRSWKKIKEGKAEPPTNEWIMLSYDPSPWRGEHYFSVTKEVPGAENVTLSGTFMTKVFEGPYKEAGKWYKKMAEYVKSQGKEAKKIYFFYTTCPKCAKHYGKNYSIAFAQV